MSDKGRSNSQQWKTPDEIIRLQRLKQKQKALQARLNRPSSKVPVNNVAAKPHEPTGKRRNPFAHSSDPKRQKKSSDVSEAELSREDSIFRLLSTERQKLDTEKPSAPSGSEKTFTNAFAQQNQLLTVEAEETDEQKPSPFFPVDWGLKTKLRILSNTFVAGNCLKTSQEASGITSFVRCLDPTSSSSLDISPGARFHQSTMYWQHPNLPWLTLFPRNTKSNNGFLLGEKEREALASDWSDSFRALFQLLRARQCPYFYVCANSFTVLFRAAGIGGRVETHAMLTPTSRGMRAALKQEGIEFTMPLKKSTDPQNRSFDSGTDTQQNSSFSNSIDDGTLEESKLTNEKDINNSHDDDDDDDEDQEKWLTSLGVEASEIKKINSIHSRNVRNAECEEDFSDCSLVLVEGIECQAFFNFLLNCKSTTTKVGKLAGVPPTLFAPVSFPGATLRNLQIRYSKVRTNNVDYQSMELRGVILPHILQYLCNLLKESKETFSASLTNQMNTISFSKAAQRLIEDLNKENNEVTSDHVFGRENLSDCGLSPHILEGFCRVSPDAVCHLERVWYNKELGGYFWSDL